MPKLYIQEGGQESVFELFEDEVSIGRGAANAIQVADTHSSKHHAVVRRVGGRPKLVDLESKNGTRVNGTFANQRWLEHGDTISIGNASIRYEASDQARAPGMDYRAAPPRAPVPVAHAAPPAAAYAPPAPTRAAAPTYAPPAPSYAPVPTYAPPQAYAPPPPAYNPPPSYAPPPRSGSSRRRDEEGEDEEEPRRGAARSSNSAAVGILVGAGVLAAIALLFLLLSRSGGLSKNVQACVRAEEVSKKDKARALHILETEADPNDHDSYVKVKEMIDSLKMKIASEQGFLDEDEAMRVRDKIYFDYVEQHKNGISNAEFVRRIQEWREKYKGHLAVNEFDNSPSDPWPKMRQLMQQNAGGKYDYPRAETDKKNEIDADLAIDHFGDAIGKWEAFRNSQKTLVSPDDFRSAENRVNGFIAEIRQKASKAFDASLAKAQDLYKSGDKVRARILMQTVKDRYGIPEYSRRAQDAIDSFK